MASNSLAHDSCRLTSKSRKRLCQIVKFVALSSWSYSSGFLTSLASMGLSLVWSGPEVGIGVLASNFILPISCSVSATLYCICLTSSLAPDASVCAARRRSSSSMFLAISPSAFWWCFFHSCSLTAYWPLSVSMACCSSMMCVCCCCICWNCCCSCCCNCCCVAAAAAAASVAMVAR